MDWHCPFLAGILNPHIQEFQQAVLIGESPFGLGQFPKLTVNRLNGISRIDNTPDVIRKLEILT